MDTIRPVSIHIVASALPPKLDGIGDYTACLSRELACSARVTILTDRDQPTDPIPDVTIKPVYAIATPRTLVEIESHILADRPDILLIQYNPFAYGKWGLNPTLPLTIRRIKRHSPQTQIILMAHEAFVPIISAKFAVMTIWQRWQLWHLSRSAKIVFFSIEPWTAQFGRKWTGLDVRHLPVGSNIPRIRIGRDEARARLNLGAETFVIGLFGTAHISRLLDWAAAGVRAAQNAGRDTLLLYMGPHGAAVKTAMGDLPHHAEGPLPAEEVSRRFAALDLYLAPFIDGVSTRRASMMTGLQHGIATIGTAGHHTDESLRREDGRSLLLADVHRPADWDAQITRLANDDALREQIGCEGQRLYAREYDWNVTARRILSALGIEADSIEPGANA